MSSSFVDVLWIAPSSSARRPVGTTITLPAGGGRGAGGAMAAACDMSRRHRRHCVGCRWRWCMPCGARSGRQSHGSGQRSSASGWRSSNSCPGVAPRGGEGTSRAFHARARLADRLAAAPRCLRPLLDRRAIIGCSSLPPLACRCVHRTPKAPRHAALALYHAPIGCAPRCIRTLPDARTTPKTWKCCSSRS